MQNRDTFIENHVKFLRPVMLSAEPYGEMEIIWIALPRNPAHSWFAGVGTSSDSALLSLERFLSEEGEIHDE